MTEAKAVIIWMGLMPKVCPKELVATEDDP